VLEVHFQRYYECLRHKVIWVFVYLLVVVKHVDR